MTKEEQNKVEVKHNDDATVTISGEIPFSYLEAERGAAVKHLGAHIKADGFREGHVPESIVIERAGEMALISEMAERALRKVYPEIVEAKNLEVIGYPQIQITKIAKDNPLGFTATVAIMPDITLPDYKALAKEQNAKKESPEVSDAEVEKQIEEILKQKAAYDRLQKAAADKKASEDGADKGDVTELPTPETVQKEAEDETVPELTDELVQTLGQPGQFKDVAEFKKNIREHLEIQKKQDTDSKHRAAITDAIIEGTKLTLPDVMVEAELGQMFAQMEEDLKRANLKMDDYLAHIKKTKEDLKSEWKPAAEKRAKLQLVLNAIAEKEDVPVDEKVLDEQVKQLLEQHKGADEKRVRVYIHSVLQNEAVMKMLEEA